MKKCKHELWVIDHLCDDLYEDWYKCVKCGYRCWFYPEEVIKKDSQYYTVPKGTELCNGKIQL